MANEVQSNVDRCDEETEHSLSVIVRIDVQIKRIIEEDSHRCEQ